MAYTDDRKAAYPEIGDQLDMLYWDIKSGNPLKDGSWFQTISKVKCDYEKPHVSEK